MKWFKVILLISLIIGLLVFTFQFVYSIKNALETPSWHYEASDEFTCVDISSDGQYIVAGTVHNQLYLFHQSISNPIWIFNSDEMIRYVAISSDGNYIAAAQYERFYVFNRSDPTPIWDFETGIGLLLNSIAISSDGQYIAAVFDRLFFFNITSRYPIWITEVESNNQVALSSDGRYIAMGGENESIYFLSFSSPIPIWSYPLYGSIDSISIDANGDYIAVGQTTSLPAVYGRIYVFNRNRSTPMWFYDYGGSVTAVDISNDGNYIVAGGYNGNISLFKTTNSNPIWHYLVPSSIYSVSISNDGSYFCCSNYFLHTFVFQRSRTIPIWSFQETISFYTGYHFQSTSCISSNGRYISFICYNLYYIDLDNPLIITDLIEFMTTNLMILGYEYLISIWLYQFIKKYIVYRKQKRDELRAELKARRINT